MPRPPQGTVEFTAILRGNPAAKEFILANYQSMALLDLSRETKVRYTAIAEFLRKRGLYANRCTIKRYNVRALLKLSPVECAYLAGIVDGEGTISAQISKDRYIRPYVTISNTAFSLLQWLRERGFYGTLGTNDHGRKYFRISWSGYQLGPLLQSIRPYLVIKGYLADLLLEIIAIRSGQRREEPVTERMREIVAEIRSFNKPGSKLEANLKRAGMSIESLPRDSLILRRD